MEKRAVSAENKPITFKLRPTKDDDIREALDLATDRDRCDRSDIIRAALRAYLLGSAKPAPVRIPAKPTVPANPTVPVNTQPGQSPKEAGVFPRSLQKLVSDGVAVSDNAIGGRLQAGTKCRKASGGDVAMDNLLNKF